MNFLNPSMQASSEVNKRSRENLTVLHTSGSKSFAKRREEMRTETGLEPSRVEFWPLTHRKNGGRGEWICPRAQELFVEMNILKSQPTAKGGMPLTNDQIADKVLGTRFGYVLGLGQGEGPRSRLSQETTSHELHETRMRAEVAEKQAKAAERHAEEAGRQADEAGRKEDVIERRAEELEGRTSTLELMVQRLLTRLG